MNHTSARLLRLLSLLQTPRGWPGSELAAKLEVSPRTVRRDVDRLRELGYPVEATMGAQGGYRLVAGAALPPLLLDDEEAVAVVLGLRTAARQPVAGIAEASLRALGKLQQVLPTRLRRRLGALAAATAPTTVPDRALVDPEQLVVLAAAIAAGERSASRTAASGALPNRTGSCRSGAAGTCSPGTTSATTGVPSAVTASRTRPRRGYAYRRANRPAVTRRRS